MPRKSHHTNNPLTNHKAMVEQFRSDLQHALDDAGITGEFLDPNALLSHDVDQCTADLRKPDACTWVKTPEGYAHISYYHNRSSVVLQEVHKKFLAYTTRHAGRQNH